MLVRGLRVTQRFAYENGRKGDNEADQIIELWLVSSVSRQMVHSHNERHRL
jgi:hypothetical protein